MLLLHHQTPELQVITDNLNGWPLKSVYRDGPTFKKRKEKEKQRRQHMNRRLQEPAPVIFSSFGELVHTAAGPTTTTAEEAQKKPAEEEQASQERSQQKSDGCEVPR